MKTSISIYFQTDQKIVKNINPYLIEANNILVKSRRTPISDLPKLRFGNMANDKGGLIFLSLNIIMLSKNILICLHTLKS